MRLRGTVFCAALIAGFLPALALADPLPSAAEPGRTPFVQPARPSGLSSAVPLEQPQGQPALLPRPANADAIQFKLQQVELTGATVFSEADLKPLWQPSLGQTIPLARLYEIADSITRAYHEQGYVLARAIIPAQEIDGGIARIVVAEGQMQSVELEGSASDTGVVAAALQSLARMKVLNIKTLEQELLMLQSLPGANFRAVLKPGTEGQVRLVLLGNAAADWSGNVLFTNTASRYLGAYLGSVGLTRQGLFQDFDETRLSFITSAQVKELQGGQLSHRLPLFIPGLALQVDASLTRGRPGYTLQDDDIESIFAQASAELEYIARYRRDSLLSFAGGFSAENSKTDLAGSLLSRDALRAVYLRSYYQWTDTFMGQSDVSATITQGLPGLLGGSRTNDANLSRADGEAGFTKLEINASRVQRVSDDWSLYGATSAQFSNTALLAAAEFGYGGSTFGRAYDSSEMTGDSGLAFLIELRGPAFDLPKGTSLQPFAFSDFGAVWNRGDGQEKALRGASVGLGLRLQTRFGLAGETYLAQPLISSNASTYPNVGGPRWAFTLSAAF